MSGISDIYSVRKEIAAPEVSLARYERLIDTTRVMFERHLWINSPQLASMNDVLRGVVATGDAVIDEYEKVESIRQASGRAMSEVSTQHTALLKRVRTSDWDSIDDYVSALEELGKVRGQLMSTRELRYVDTDAIDAMTTSVNETQAEVSQRTAGFIATDAALQQEIYDYTKTAPMVKGVTPTFPNPSQTDIDAYAAEGMIQDVNLGNNQLVWGGFQEENAKDIAEYLQGNITIEEALNAADARRDNSK